jgi:hypothetical protein
LISEEDGEGVLGLLEETTVSTLGNEENSKVQRRRFPIERTYEFRFGRISG